MTPTETSAKGNAYALAAYAMWGVFPLYWHLFHGMPAWHILAWRVLSSQIFVSLYLVARGELAPVARLLADPRRLGFLALSSLAISANWLLYIWAVNSGHVVESSMGYFINPLVNVLLGVLLFRERPRPWQWLAIAVASTAVLVLALSHGQVPWVALGLAFTFGGYGALKKVSKVSSTAGLWVETTLVVVPAAAILAFGETSAWDGLLTLAPGARWALMTSGIVTALPLVLFAAAARMLPLATLGFFQYVAPVLQFLCALLFFQEPMDQSRWIVFAMIWVGLAIFGADAWRFARRPRPAPIADVVA